MTNLANYGVEHWALVFDSSHENKSINYSLQTIMLCCWICLTFLMYLSYSPIMLKRYSWQCVSPHNLVRHLLINYPVWKLIHLSLHTQRKASLHLCSSLQKLKPSWQTAKSSQRQSSGSQSNSNSQQCQGYPLCKSWFLSMWYNMSFQGALLYMHSIPSSQES